MNTPIPLATILNPSDGQSTSPGIATPSIQILEPAISPESANRSASIYHKSLQHSSSSAQAPPATRNDQSDQPWPKPGTMAASTPGNSPHLSQSVTTTHNPSKEEADRQPWRYRGYPAFCRWMASDDDFFLLRRFGSSSARIALYFQDQIVELENALKAEDNEAIGEGGDSGTFRHDCRSNRRKILENLASIIERYQKFVLNHMELKSRPKATTFQLSNVRQWLKNANSPIDEEEVAFLREEDDLVPVVSTPKAPLRRFIDKFTILRLPACFREKTVRLRRKPFTSYYADTLSQKRNRSLYSEEDFEMQTTIYNKDRLLDKLVTCITVMLGLAMLIGPLWLLQHLATQQSNLQARLGVITGFLVLFTILTSLFTVAKPFEVLAATAAYGAVLMMFMQFGTYPTASNGG